MLVVIRNLKKCTLVEIINNYRGRAKYGDLPVASRSASH